MFSVLRDVVKSMVPVPDVPTLYWDNTDPSHPFASRMEYHFGDDTASDDSYEFVSTGPGQWSWTGVPLSKSNECPNPGDSSDKESMVQSVNVPVPGAPPVSGGTLSFTPGKEGISLTGKSTFVLRYSNEFCKLPSYIYRYPTF
ncbi:hypothetical protein V8C34DRAFT_302412 [Trichoderma compactum]